MKYDQDSAFEAGIEALDEPISPGSGLLKMLIDAHGMAPNVDDQALSREYLDSGTLISSNAKGEFTAATYVASAEMYIKNYEHHMRGAGLQSSLSRNAIPVILPGFTTAEVKKSVSPSSPFSAEDIAWVANVAAVKAMVRTGKMAGDVAGIDLLRIAGIEEPFGIELRFTDIAETIQVSHPRDIFSLRKDIFEVITHLHFENTREALDSTVQAFVEHFAVDAGSEQILKETIYKLPAFVKLTHSSTSLVNLPGIIEAEKTFVNTLDRKALADACKHTSKPSSLKSYLAHSDPGVQADVEKHAVHGALAPAFYSDRTLSVVASAYAGNESCYMNSQGRYPGAEFFRAMEASLNDKSRACLAKLAPRYLLPLIAPRQEDDRVSMHTDIFYLRGVNPSGANVISLWGQEMAEALNQYFDTPGEKKLPAWSEAFNSDAIKQLFMNPISSAERVDGIRNFLHFAEALRSRNQPSSSVRNTAYIGSGFTQKLVGANGDTPQKKVESIFSALNDFGVSSTLIRTSANRMAAKVFGDAIQDWGPLLSVAHVPLPIFAEDSARIVEPKIQSKLKGYLESTREWQVEYCVLDLYFNNAESSEFDPGSDKDDDITLRYHLILKSDSVGVDGTKTTIWNQLEATCKRGYFGSELAFSVSRPATDEIYFSVVNKDSMGNRRESDYFFPFPRAATINKSAIPSPVRAVHQVATEGNERFLNAFRQHTNSLISSVSKRVLELVIEKPLLMSCLLPSVNPSDGALDDKMDAKVSKETGRILFRSAMSTHSTNAIAPLISRMKDVESKKNGLSIFDIALESSKSRFPELTITALADHPQFKSSPERFSDFLSESAGKLIERHPSLVPLATQHGMRIDDVAKMAWDALHPIRQTPHALAVLKADAMSKHIESRLKENGSDLNSPTPLASSAKAPRRPGMRI